MTLEFVELTDYQRFRRLRLELDPRVTVLTGPSDAGKSSVLRALRQVCLNPTLRARPKDAPPRGPRAARHGRKSFTIRLGVDGRVVTLRRGATNVYWLDGERYAELRSARVPKPVRELLLVSESSFQQQHSQPYWLFLSPGQVGKELNKIVALDVMDRTLAAALRRLRQHKAGAAVHRGLSRAARGELGRLRRVPRFVQLVASLRDLAKDVARRGRELSDHRTVLGRVEEARARLETLQKTPEANVEEIEKLGQRVRVLQNKIAELDQLLEDVGRQRNKVSEHAAALRVAADELRRKTEGLKTCPLCDQNLPNAT